MEDQFGFQCCSDLSNLLYITPLYFGKIVGENSSNMMNSGHDRPWTYFKK